MPHELYRGQIIEKRTPYPHGKPNAFDFWLICIAVGIIAGLLVVTTR